MPMRRKNRKHTRCASEKIDKHHSSDDQGFSVAGPVGLKVSEKIMMTSLFKLLNSMTEKEMMMADDGKMRSINSDLLLFIQTEIHDIRDDDDTPTPTHSDNKNLTDSIMSTFFCFFFVSHFPFSKEDESSARCRGNPSCEPVTDLLSYCCCRITASKPTSAYCFGDSLLLDLVQNVFCWLIGATGRDTADL